MRMEKRNIILIKKRKIEYSTRETSKSRFEREKETENLNNSRPEPIEALSSRASFNLLLLLLKLLLLLMLLRLREAPDAPRKAPPHCLVNINNTMKEINQIEISRKK